MSADEQKESEMRIRTSGSDPMDFHRRCAPKTEADAFKKYGNLGDGPDGRGNCFTFDDDHPDYDGEEYTCEKCGKLLTGADD
jgi:hypothetical protein